MESLNIKFKSDSLKTTFHWRDVFKAIDLKIGPFAVVSKQMCIKKIMIEILFREKRNIL